MASKPHDFLPTSVGFTPTLCFVCNEFLNGPWNTPYQCASCGINVHDVCRGQAAKTCFITHKFKLSSYYGFSNCAACGKPLIGIYNQGYRCEECGIDVHATCRTQSSVSACRAHQTNANATMMATIEGKRNSRRASLNKMMTAASGGAVASSSSSSQTGSQPSSTGGSSSTTTTTPAPLLTGASDANLPRDFEALKKEIKMIHARIIEIDRLQTDNWEKVEKPSLKSERAQLQQAYDAAKLKKNEKAKQVAALSKDRDEAFRAFLMGFYKKYHPSKANAKHVASVMAYFGSGKERDAFASLLSKYGASDPTAVPYIENERAHGISANGALEKAMAELERLSSEAAKLKKMLDVVKRDVHFPPSKRWLFKAGAEGNYVAFTSLWVQDLSGSNAIRCAMMKGEDKIYRPTIQLVLKKSPNADNKEEGCHFKARVEDLGIFGSALPVALHLREATIDVTFELNITAYFDNSNTNANKDEEEDAKGASGRWRVSEKGFNLKIIKFSLKTPMVASNLIPDVILQQIIRSFITLAFKKFVTTIMPPEIGSYMNAIHEFNSSNGSLNAGAGEEETNPHMYEDGESETAPWESGSRTDNVFGGEKVEEKERFLVLEISFSVKVLLDLEAGGAALDNPKDEAAERARKALGMTLEDAVFFSKLRKGNLSINSMKEVTLPTGDEATTASWLAATLAGGGGGSGSDVPLNTVNDLVRYFREFILRDSGIDEEKRGLAERLVKCWQIAFDLGRDGHSDKLHDDKDGGGLGGRLKRLVGNAAASSSSLNPNPNSNSTSSFSFYDLVSRLAELDRKEMRTVADISKFEVAFASRAFLRAARDAAIRVLSGGQAALAGTLITSTLELPSSVPAAQNINNVAGQLVSAVIPTGSQSGSSSKPNVVAKIEKASDLLSHVLKEIQERYVSSLKTRVELTTGNGQFKAEGKESKLISPVDVGLHISESIVRSVGSREVASSQTPNPNSTTSSSWPWRRTASVEGGYLKMQFTKVDNAGANANTGDKTTASKMLDAALKLAKGGGKASAAPGSSTNPNSSAKVVKFEFSGLLSTFSLSSSSAALNSGSTMNDVLTFRLLPMQDPNQLQVRAMGAKGMRIITQIDHVVISGGLDSVFDYFEHWMTFLSKNFPSAIKTLRVFEKFIAGLAVRDTFFIDFLAWVRVRGDARAGDLIVWLNNHPSKSCVKLNLNHHLVDFFHDLNDLFEGIAGYSTNNLSAFNE